MKEKILGQFDDKISLYTRYGEKCKDIILELIKDNNISIHNINARPKERDSLSKKIDTRKGKYSDLSEITDISGIRIITYLESDVDKVAEIIEKEFLIDPTNSIDKRKRKSDQFGYMSLHYVVSLNQQRQAITENIKFTGLKLEIQIRSILQHAWAEIEHDLGYKGVLAIPENFKRNFNRLAALLETADIEFDRLKRELSEYELKVKDDIIAIPNQVLINQASISSFISTNKIFEKARNIIQKNTGCVFYEKVDFKSELERFELFKIETIGALDEIITQNEKHYLSFVDKFTEKMTEEKLNSSLPLFYFQHFLACKSNSAGFVEKYFNYGSFLIGGGVGSRTAKEFIDLYNDTK